MKRAGKRLRRARKAAGFSQNGLGLLVGVSQPLIAQCEAGVRPIYPLLRKRLASKLGISEDDLQ